MIQWSQIPFLANILIIPFNNRFKLVYMIHNIVVGVVVQFVSYRVSGFIGKRKASEKWGG